MTLAIMTIGTSFQEALCWDLKKVFTPFFEDPLISENIKPSEWKIKDYRHKMLNAFEDEISAPHLTDPFSVLTASFKTIKTSQQYWRYPAEIDTLLTLQSERFDDIFKDLDEIKLVHSDDAGGGVFAKNVLEFIIKELWPNKFQISAISYRALTAAREFDISELRDHIKNSMARKQEALLILTGGYKLLSIIGAFAFGCLNFQNHHYRIAYKHEDGALIVHEGLDRGYSAF